VRPVTDRERAALRRIAADAQAADETGAAERAR
jgi:hypothetical protein